MAVWVDFKTIKETVGIQAVLQRYGVKLKRAGKNELRGPCPIHGRKQGSDSFHASTAKNAFQCFDPSCQAHGNVLDLVAAMERCSVREAAVKLSGWYGISSGGGGDQRSAAPATGSKLAPEKVGERAEPNKPLTFRLQGIDSAHPYLASRGINRETAESFGVGFFPGKGSMTGRLVIPIHNEKGELVAYAGRSIDGSEPKYKLPAGFKKSLELYALHRATSPEGGGVVVVVEGFFDCLKVWQAGLPAVALMGCSLSQEQEDLLAGHFRGVWLMLDGDEAGRKATADILPRLAQRLFVKVVDVGDGRQPDQLTDREIAVLLK